MDDLRSSELNPTETVGYYQDGATTPRWEPTPFWRLAELGVTEMYRRP